MRIAETVTFGGSGLDRAAALRRAPDRLAGLLEAGGRVLPVWRGKVLLAGDGTLGRVASGHPALAEARGAPVFLGLDGGVAQFAADISAWQPAAEALPPAGGFLDTTEQRHPGLPDDHRFVELRAVMATLSPRDAELAAVAKGVIGWHRSHGFCAACGAPSEVIEAGWQRLCPACGARHFPRTDPVVIMLVTRGDRTLVGRAPGWPEGMYSCLAGFMEPGETLEAAVRREVAEETGVEVGAVRYLASQPWPFPASLMLGCEGTALSEAITLDPAELEDARWVTRVEMAAALAGTHPAIRRPRNGAIAGFLLANWVADRLD